MSLKETLKKLNQTEDETYQKAVEAKAELERIKTEFTNAVKPCFNEIVIPKLNEIIKIFNNSENNGKYKAKHGQVKAITYMSSSQSDSINIHIPKSNVYIQIDIVAEIVLCKIKFYSIFSGFNRTIESKNNDLSLTVQETTSEAIEEFIEKQINLVSEK